MSAYSRREVSNECKRIANQHLVFVEDVSPTQTLNAKSRNSTFTFQRSTPNAIPLTSKPSNHLIFYLNNSTIPSYPFFSAIDSDVSS
jgi:hypothetical protein